MIDAVNGTWTEHNAIRNPRLAEAAALLLFLFLFMQLLQLLLLLLLLLSWITSSRMLGTLDTAGSLASCCTTACRRPA